MGYRSVGKTSLSLQFVEGQFEESYDPTIENTFLKTTFFDDEEYELKLVDTAGQDEYSILPAHYSMDIHGYVLVYSVTSPKSFEIVQIIYNKLLDVTGRLSVPVILVGNKKDLHMNRLISYEEGSKLAAKWKASFIEASAKQNEVTSKESISEVFHGVIMEIEKANGNIPDKTICSIS